MRVVHITTVPESLVSYLRGQIEFLRERGVDVIAVSSPGDHLDAFAKEFSAEVVAVEMPRKITPLRDLRSVSSLVRMLRAQRPQIIHAHTPKGGLLGMISGWIAGVPVRIYHMRGLPLETATGWRRALLTATERTSCALATRVLCVSSSLREVAVREQLVDPAKIEVLANGSGQGVDALGKFDPSRLAPTVRTDTRRRHGIPEDAVVLGYFGRLVRDKGILELLEAWHQLRAAHPELHLILAGVIEERDALPAGALAALRDDAKIHLLPFDWNTPPLYAAMDIVVLPTYREGFPNVPLEAAAMMRPVVATRVSGCIDAVVDGVTGLLVPPRDAHALAAALRRYIEDPELRARHAAAARERVVRSFRREILWEAIHKTYLELTA